MAGLGSRFSKPFSCLLSVAYAFTVLHAACCMLHTVNACSESATTATTAFHSALYKNESCIQH